MAEQSQFDERLRAALVVFGQRADRDFDALAVARDSASAAGRVGVWRAPRMPWPAIGLSGYLPIVVSLGLLLALLASAAISGGLSGLLRRPPGLIVFTTAELTREPAPSRSFRDRNWLSANNRTISTISAVSVDGGTPTRLIDVPGEPVPIVDTGIVARVGPEPVWSPDGTRIAFRPEGEAPGIYVMNRDGSDLIGFAQSEGGVRYSEMLQNSNLAWSPDGARIAFITPHLSPFYTPTNGLLVILDLATGVVSNVGGGDAETPASGSVAWSPDGSRIAFARTLGLGAGLDQLSSDIFTVNTDGSDERRLNAGDGRLTHIGPIAWSPDGAEIAFEQEDIGGESMHWYAIRDDGTMRREIRRERMVSCCIHHAYGGWLQWSPDGSLIASPRAVMAADGSGGLLETDMLAFDWSPDGSQLVYSAPASISMVDSDYNATSIYIVNADGTGRTWLADGDYPAWSP